MSGRLERVGEALRTDGLSEVFRDKKPVAEPAESTRAIPTLSLARSGFIEKFYPHIFGSEEMGDVAKEFEPSEITSILVAYEGYLIQRGVLDIRRNRGLTTEEQMVRDGLLSLDAIESGE